MVHKNESTARVLARVVRLGPVTKHPHTDRLQISQVGGWKVVVGTQVWEGDLGVYFEIDSVLPKDEDWVKALQLRSNVIRTLNLRRELSQGLFVEMPKLPLACCLPEDDEKWLQTGDVTELLAVQKRFDPPDLVFSSKQKGANVVRIQFETVFPEGPSKTNELRVQSCMEMLEKMMGKPYYITTKIDGSSATYGLDGTWGGFVICSRNLLVDKEDAPSTPYGIAAQKYGLAQKLALHPNLVVQAEVYGYKINCNLLNIQDFELAVFTIFDQEKRAHLSLDEMKDWCDMSKVPMVPIEEEGECFSYTLADLLEKAKGFYPRTRNHKEGLVVRLKTASEEEEYRGLPLSFKVINNDYLLKHG